MIKKTNEVHVLLKCIGTKRDRELAHIDRYIRWARRAGITSDSKILENYLGGDGAKTNKLKDRGTKIQLIITRWLQKTAENQ